MLNNEANAKLKLTKEEIAHHNNLPFSCHPTDEPQTLKTISAHLIDFALMLAEIDTFDCTLLDIGAGGGWTTDWFCKCGIKAVAGDISPHWLDICKQRYRNLAFRLVDAEKMIFSNDTFDYVVYYNSLHHINNQEKAISETYRILNKNGCAIFLEPGTSHSHSQSTKDANERFDTEEKGINAFKLAELCKKVGFKEVNIKTDYSIHTSMRDSKFSKSWLYNSITMQAALSPALVIGSLKGRAFVVARK